MKPGEKAMLGHRVRRFRKDMGLNQKEMAQELDISASYLNLIEHNQRPVTVPLLFRLGQVFDVDLQNFAEDDSARLSAELVEIFSDSLFAGHEVGRNEIREMVAAAPGVATAVCDLHRAYRQLREEMQAVVGPQASRTPGPRSPLDAVRIFQEQANNHFPELEEVADQFRAQGKLVRDDLFNSMVRHLGEAHDISVRVMPVHVMENQLRRFDLHRKRILLSEALQMPQRIFQLASQAAFLAHGGVLDELAGQAKEQSAETLQLLRIMLASYFAGAVMMPYDEFLESAREVRHDLDLLTRRFGASFEQVCHRLTTLQRSGGRGIPFFFLRVDNAGNVSKRLSAGSMQFARFGGTCPRLGVYDAFGTRGVIHSQVSALADDQRYFTISRTLEPGWVRPDEPAPVVAVALGCELRHARDISYADGIDLAKPGNVTEIGLSCQMCERMNCTQRAYPPLNRALKFDPNIRHMGMFELNQ